jgi:hypothetical protein
MGSKRYRWAERITALAWPLIIPVCTILWQCWLERVLPRLLERRRSN